MSIKSFEDLTVWQDAQLLAKSVYTQFNSLREYSFKDQILRASLSISNNIAEGYERDTTKEYIRFLFIAKGSCGEVRSMLYLAKELNFISSKNFTEMLTLSKMISSKLMNLIRKPSQH